MLQTIITAIITYLATSMDEISILFMLYSNPKNKGKALTITATYCTGTFLLIGIGLIGAHGLVQIPVKWAVGLIGFIPLLMGIKELLKREDEDEKATDPAKNRKSLCRQVLIITMALGVDDLGVYIPLFTTKSGRDIALMVLIFAVGALLLSFISYRMICINKLTNFIENKERYIEGFVFIAIGIMVMIECGTINEIMRRLS